MRDLIPNDIQYFLEEVGNFPSDTPGAFEAYVKSVGTLLYDKYCVSQNPSLQILPTPRVGRAKHVPGGRLATESADWHDQVADQWKRRN